MTWGVLRWVAWKRRSNQATLKFQQVPALEGVPRMGGTGMTGMGCCPPCAVGKGSLRDFFLLDDLLKRILAGLKELSLRLTPQQDSWHGGRGVRIGTCIVVYVGGTSSRQPSTPGPSTALELLPRDQEAYQLKSARGATGRKAFCTLMGQDSSPFPDRWAQA